MPQRSSGRAHGVSWRNFVFPKRLQTSIDFDPYAASIDHLIDAWLPLTFAFNSINRSMGENDLYPFVLGAPTILKLTYIYDKIHRLSLSPPGE